MRRNVFGVVVVGLVVAGLLAALVGPFASASPDGLAKVAADKSLDTAVEDHALADGPLADYGFGGVDDERLGTGLAGLIGVGVTFAVGFVVFATIKRVRTTSDPVSGPRREPSSASEGRSATLTIASEPSISLSSGARPNCDRLGVQDASTTVP